MTRFAVGAHEYLLARSTSDEWFASDLSCTHAYFELDCGALVGRQVACVSHGAIFDLKDGSVVASPAARALRVFPVRLDGDDVLVDVPDGDEPPRDDASA